MTLQLFSTVDVGLGTGVVCASQRSLMGAVNSVKIMTWMDAGVLC